MSREAIFQRSAATTTRWYNRTILISSSGPQRQVTAFRLHLSLSCLWELLPFLGHLSDPLRRPMGGKNCIQVPKSHLLVELWNDNLSSFYYNMYILQCTLCAQKHQNKQMKKHYQIRWYGVQSPWKSITSHGVMSPQHICADRGFPSKLWLCNIVHAPTSHWIEGGEE